jgi:hypothetical protein
MNDTSSWGVPLVIIAAAIVTAAVIALTLYWAPSPRPASGATPAGLADFAEQVRKPWRDEPIEVKPIRTVSISVAVVPPVQGPLVRAPVDDGPASPPRLVSLPSKDAAAPPPPSTVGRHAADVCERHHLRKETYNRGHSRRCVR